MQGEVCIFIGRLLTSSCLLTSQPLTPGKGSGLRNYNMTGMLTAAICLWMLNTCLELTYSGEDWTH